MSILRIAESGTIWVIENGRSPYEVYVPNPRSLRRTYKNNFTLAETKVITKGRPIREVCDNTRTGLMSCAWRHDGETSLIMMIFRGIQEALRLGPLRCVVVLPEKVPRSNIRGEFRMENLSMVDGNYQTASFSITWKIVEEKRFKLQTAWYLLVINTMLSIYIDSHTYILNVLYIKSTWPYLRGFLNNYNCWQ